jgi:hypothetical protein
MHFGISDIAAEIRVRNAIAEIEWKEVPSQQILELFKGKSDLNTIHEHVIQATGFSPERAAHYIIELLPPGISYCIENGGLVVDNGYSMGTHAYHQWPGQKFLIDPYHYFISYSIHQTGQLRTHWWQMDTAFAIPEEQRPWRCKYP